MKSEVDWHVFGDRQHGETHERTLNVAVFELNLAAGIAVSSTRTTCVIDFAHISLRLSRALIHLEPSFSASPVGDHIIIGSPMHCIRSIRM